MIRVCRDEERPAILAIVNAAAEAYRGVIPADRWHEPYMAGAVVRILALADGYGWLPIPSFDETTLLNGLADSMALDDDPRHFVG